jgi:prenyltransferase beta subunit
MVKQKALSYIKRHQNPDGGWGFNTKLESEADTSSIILFAIRKSKLLDEKNDAINYFKTLQFKDTKFKGLWPVWRKTERPSPEVVGHIIKALMVNKSDIDVSLAQKWLQEKILYKDWKAHWGRNAPYSIYAIIEALGVKDTKNKLVKYLLTNQNKDGGWGAHEEEKSNVSATANAVMALKILPRTAQILKKIQKGLQYLIDNQQDNGTWTRVTEVIGPRPFTYADDASTHNFVMQALLK